MSGARLPITVPQMGVVERILVVEWLVDDGARVSAGDPVVVIDTDKALTELTSPASGILEIMTAAGEDEVPVGAVLGYVAER